MSFANPVYRISRQSVVGMEGMFVKMFDPPTESPETPDMLSPTNPVPEVMAQAGIQSAPSVPHTVQRDLLHGLKIPTWDGLKEMQFFVFRDKDNPSLSGNYPAGTIRVPRGCIFHGMVEGHGPPPHTIHWHGIEPTPINDGVGHCSMEIGMYAYQWQPNFIGTYFYHCHRNTVQHFEFGLFGLLLIEPADAYFATQQNPAIPIGHCRDGLRRIAANLSEFPQFPGFNPSPIDAPDPLGQFPADPHAMTVPYDVEALWVLDDRDSAWSDLASDARATYPKQGDIPGVNDNFHGNAGGGLNDDDFFAFNDFNPDYWYVTGVPVPAHRGGVGTMPEDIVIPAALNSGISGTQVSINAQAGQTILIRCLDAAYNCTELTFPMDVVIIAWDGRALGVAPYGKYNHPYLIPANTPIHQSVARRCDILIRATQPINTFATVRFLDTRGQVPGEPQTILVTARIPIVIGGEPVVSAASGTVTSDGAPLSGVTLTLSGQAQASTTSDASGNYSFADLADGNYTITPSRAGYAFTPLSRNVTLSGADVTEQNFSGTQAAAGFSVSGRVVTFRGRLPLSGVAMTLSGDASAVVFTDASGNYSFTGLANGVYAITPSSGASVFLPSKRSVFVRGANSTGKNFYKI